MPRPLAPLAVSVRSMRREPRPLLLDARVFRSLAAVSFTTGAVGASAAGGGAGAGVGAGLGDLELHIQGFVVLVSHDTLKVSDEFVLSAQGVNVTKLLVSREAEGELPLQIADQSLINGRAVLWGPAL